MRSSAESRLAWELLSLALAALAVVGPKTLDLSELVMLQPLPLAAAGLVLGSASLRRRHSFRALLAALMLAAAGTRVCAAIWPTVDSGLIALEFLIAGLMAVGALFDDCARPLSPVLCVCPASGVRCGRHGSLPVDRGHPFRQRGCLASSGHRGRDGGLWVPHSRSLVLRRRGRECGHRIRLFEHADLPATAPSSGGPRPDRLRAIVLPARRCDQPEESRRMAS